MSRVLCAFVACAAGLMTACFSPALDGFACGPDRGCPKGYECSADNVCVRPGAEPGTPDAGGVDADLGPAPNASIAFPLPVGMTEAASITVRGTASPAASGGAIRTVRVNGIGAISVNDYQDWTVEIALELGLNVVRVETEDDLGNVDPNAASASILRTSPLVFQPVSVAVNLTGTQAVIFDDRTDALMTMDLTTGERTLIADDATGMGGDIVRLEQLALNAAGDTVYSVDAPAVTVVSIDVATGDRTVISGGAIGGGEALQVPIGLALDEANGKLLVGDDGANRLFAVDLAGGQRTLLSGADALGALIGAGPVFATIEAVAFDALNNRVLVADSGLLALMSVDLATGNRTIVSSNETVGAGPPLVFPVGVALGANAGEAFVADRGMGAIVRVDLATGDRSVVSGGETGTGVPLPGLESVAAHPDGTRVFATDSTHLVPVVIDVVTRERSLVTPASVGTGLAPGAPEGMALDAARGRLLIADDSLDGVLTVDLATGNRAMLGEDIFVPLNDLEGIALDPAGNRAVVLDNSLDACIAVDLVTGALTVLSSDSVGGGPDMQEPRGLALDAAGTTAWVVDPSRGGAVFTVDLVSKLREYLSDNQNGIGINLEAPEAVILDQARNHLLVVDSINGVIAVDLASGNRAVVGTGGEGPAITSPRGIALATPDTALVYDANAGYLLLDLVAGGRTEVATAELRPGVSLSTPEVLMVDPARNVLLLVDNTLKAVIALDLTTKERLIISR
jgi:DNA-binding beta-propeller fold protein YncE